MSEREYCFLWFHDWAKWKSYEENMTRILSDGTKIRFLDLRQSRICKRCGKMQDKLIKKGCK